MNPKFSLQSVSAASPSGLSGLGLGEDCAFTCVALDLAQGIFALGINVRNDTYQSMMGCFVSISININATHSTKNGDILLVSHPILSAAAGSNSAAEDRRLHSITTSQEQHRSSSSSPPPSSSIERLLVYGDSSSTSSLTSPGNMLFGSQPMRLSAIKSLTFKQGDKYLVAIDDKNQVMVWNTYSYSAVWERPLKLEANAEFISCHHVSKVSNWVFFGMSNGDIVCK